MTQHSYGHICTPMDPCETCCLNAAADCAERMLTAEEYAADFVGDFGIGMLAEDLGPRLTCTEAVGLVRLLAVCGQKEAAHTLLEAHVEGDDDDSDEDHTALLAELAETLQAV